MSQSLAELTYASTIRALDMQEKALTDLRSRTGVIVAAATLTSSFLGAQAIKEAGALELPGWLAVAALACCVFSCVYILLPKQGFVFSLSGPRVYEQMFEYAGDTDEVHRRLVYWLEEFWVENRDQLDALARYYAFACAMLLAQLILWCVSLASIMN